MAQKKSSKKELPKKQEKAELEIKIDNVVPFTYELVKLMYEIAENLGRLETHYGVRFEEFGKIFDGGKFSLIATSLDPKKLGVFVQFLFELNANQLLEFDKIMSSDTATKLEIKEKLKQILEKYKELFEE